jgi:hypothetical protein
METEAAMVQLDLTQQERDELVHVLRDSLSDLRMEISATDGMEFRDALKERKEVLHKVLTALGEHIPETPPINPNS